MRPLLRNDVRLTMVGLPTALAIGTLLSCEAALAQAAGAQTAGAPSAGAPPSPASAAASSDGQRSLDALKATAGKWRGPVAVSDPEWAAKAAGPPLAITMRVASSGDALLQELGDPRLPEITLFYVDGDRLTLVHYCDFKNRPRMVARPSQDQRTIEFDLVDVAGVDAPGHVTHAVFTLIDTDHHTEDWTFAVPGKPPFHAVMDLRRVP
ncbi:hypothetical protein tb265_43570 [Gemmatimonadetes bacterium T265]|nr:hypothetical protein tb265_43570 [Gemmatimonadetes bacterium T265]